jgi:ABC-type dipeptide/oligopeptide/nickel transport system permease subunit
MLSAGRQFIYTDPLLCLWPGIAIVLAVLAFNFIGDGLRDALDPRLER